MTTVASTLPISHLAVTVCTTSRQQPGAVDPGVGRIVIGKVGADVAEAGRAEQGVADGVGHGIGVAVTGQAAPLDGHPGEDQRTVRVVAEGMDVEAEPDPGNHEGTTAARAATTTRSRRRGHLQVVGGAVDEHDPAARGLHQGGVVGGVGARQVGLAQDSGPKRLGGLHGHQAGPVQGDQLAVGADLLDGVGDRSGRDGAVGAGLPPRRGPPATAPAGPAAGRRRAPRSRRRVAGTAANPARTDCDRVDPPATTASASHEPPDGVSGDDQDHAVARLAGDVERPRGQRPAAEIGKLLGAAEAAARTAGDDDCPGLHGRRSVLPGQDR